MKKFIYNIKYYTLKKLDEILESMGKNGWELVSMLAMAPVKRGMWKCYFKREDEK